VEDGGFAAEYRPAPVSADDLALMRLTGAVAIAAAAARNGGPGHAFSRRPDCPSKFAVRRLKGRS
jgi:hypothetical protein